MPSFKDNLDSQFIKTEFKQVYLIRLSEFCSDFTECQSRKRKPNWLGEQQYEAVCHNLTKKAKNPISGPTLTTENHNQGKGYGVVKKRIRRYG